MRTVVIGPNREIDEMIARRQFFGQDLYDEVWKGEYHVAPAPTGAHAQLQILLPLLLNPHARAAGLFVSGPFNLGQKDDYRVPDGGYHRASPVDVWIDTAAIVVEIISPDDETYDKFDFYAASGVEEIIVADPAARTIELYVRHFGQEKFYARGDSPLLGVTSAELVAGIDWP